MKSARWSFYISLKAECFVERAFKPAMPAFMRAFFVAQSFLPVEAPRKSAAHLATLPAEQQSRSQDRSLTRTALSGAHANCHGELGLC